MAKPKALSPDRRYLITEFFDETSDDDMSTTGLCVRQADNLQLLWCTYDSNAEVAFYYPTGDLLTLTSDNSRVRRLDLQTGRVLSERVLSIPYPRNCRFAAVLPDGTVFVTCPYSAAFRSWALAVARAGPEPSSFNNVSAIDPNAQWCAAPVDAAGESRGILLGKLLCGTFVRPSVEFTLVSSSDGRTLSKRNVSIQANTCGGVTYSVPSMDHSVVFMAVDSGSPGSSGVTAVRTADLSTLWSLTVATPFVIPGPNIVMVIGARGAATGVDIASGVTIWRSRVRLVINDFPSRNLQYAFGTSDYFVLLYSSTVYVHRASDGVMVSALTPGDPRAATNGFGFVGCPHPSRGPYVAGNQVSAANIQPSYPPISCIESSMSSSSSRSSSSGGKASTTSGVVGGIFAALLAAVLVAVLVVTQRQKCRGRTHQVTSVSLEQVK